MSETAGDSAAGGDSGVSPPPARPAYRGVAIALAAALLLLAALAATAPFWAPALPWAPPAADPRIGHIEQALQQIRREQASAAAARQQLDRRVAALAATPAPPPADIADLRQQVAKLSSGAADLAERIAGIDQAVQAQAKTSAEAAARLAALEEALHHDTASGSSDTAILLVLLQIRDALASGRPFAAEYDTLASLTRNRPPIIAAAAALAVAAKTGVAGRAVLAARLHQLAPAIDKAAAPEPAGAAHGWGDQLLRRLQGLVRVRRIDGAGSPAPGGATAAVDAAEQALAGGDLEAAVAALDKLRGGAADAAHGWLDMAKQRLAAEHALQHIETALTADLAAKPPAAAELAR